MSTSHPSMYSKHLSNIQPLATGNMLQTSKVHLIILFFTVELHRSANIIQNNPSLTSVKGIRIRNQRYENLGDFCNSRGIKLPLL